MKMRLIFEQILNENILSNINDMTFYHGTNSDISFSDLKISSQAGDYGSGLYLTTNKQYAARHGKFLLSGKIDVKRPVLIGSPEYNRDIYPELGGPNPKMYLTAEVAKRKGYDSIIIDRNEDDIWAVLLKDGLIEGQ